MFQGNQGIRSRGQKLIEQENKLFGLDAPDKQEVRTVDSFETIVGRVNERRGEIEKLLAARGQMMGDNGVGGNGEARK